MQRGVIYILELYKNIKAKRKELGLTQAELASKLGYADKSMIAKIEKGAIDLPQSKIIAFANALGTTPSDLMGWMSDEEIGNAFYENMHQPIQGDIKERYYLNNDAKELAEFLYENPEYKILFDASRKVKKEDIDFVKQMIDRMSGDKDDT